MKQFIKNTIKSIIRQDLRKFNRICSGINLSLDFKLNKDSIRVLEAIFKEREYADYFPFHEEAVILDAGGHYGYFAFFASMNLSPKSKIFSLEPSPSNFYILKSNLEKNDFENINPINCGLGAKTMTTPLFGGYSYNHSTVNQEGKKVISQVQISSLDDFLVANELKKIDFLKLDCEGAEYEVLFNTSSESFEKIKTISMEFHDQKTQEYTPNKLIEFLETNKYKIVKFHYDIDFSLSNLNFGKIVATKR